MFMLFITERKWGALLLQYKVGNKNVKKKKNVGDLILYVFEKEIKLER